MFEAVIDKSHSDGYRNLGFNTSQAFRQAQYDTSNLAFSTEALRQVEFRTRHYILNPLAQPYYCVVDILNPFSADNYRLSISRLYK